MFLSNYAVCILLAILFGLRVNTSAFSEGVIFPIGMGLISGIMYLVNFILLQVNINRNGIVLSTTFMKLGVIVPTIMAVVVFHETLTLTSIAGILHGQLHPRRHAAQCQRPGQQHLHLQHLQEQGSGPALDGLFLFLRGQRLQDLFGRGL